MITGRTQLLGVIGHPIAHTLSPLMHNAAIAQLGLDFVYLPFAIQPGDLAAAMQGFAAIGLRGFSVTIPHKQAIVPFLSEVTDLAQAVGAVNTVWRTETGWSGTNTDVAGFVAPLQNLPLQTSRPWSETIALVLGNGGAARAVVAGCAQLGCAEIHVVGRDAQKLAAFQQGTRSPLQTHPWDKLADLLPRAGLLVNTTPVGMSPTHTRSPLTVAETDRLSPTAIAYDLIYTPRPTVFLQQARDRGCLAIDGLEMLVQQGAAALQQWLGQPVPVDVMRRSLHQHLQPLGLTN